VDRVITEVNTAVKSSLMFLFHAVLTLCCSMMAAIPEELFAVENLDSL